MSAWRWVAEDGEFGMDDGHLAEHDGLDGVRDKNAVLAALARPAAA